MDPRCPRKLKCYPKVPCLEAVKRLKAIKLYGGSHVDAFCPWAVMHQMSNYCFFVYMDKYCRDHTVEEIAYYLMEDKETVEEILKTATNKLKNDINLQELSNTEPPKT